MKVAVDIQNLLFSFDKNVVVDIPSLKVNEADLFGIIGPDGAGKTTLFRLIASLYIPDDGHISVLGNDTVKEYKNIRQFTGYMPGKFSLYEDLTVRENLEFFATIFNTTIAENYSIIEEIYCMLEPFEKRRAGALSGGMKQKLALCCALIHRPKLLLLDEPTTGVDPVSRKEFWEMLLKLKKEGITIIVSTPYMDEATNCNRIAFMQNSKILTTNSPQDIIKSYPKELFFVKSNQIKTLVNDLRNFKNSHSAYSFGDSVHYADKRNQLSTHNLTEIEHYLKDKGHLNIQISPGIATIEDCFIEYLQNSEESK